MDFERFSVVFDPVLLDLSFSEGLFETLTFLCKFTLPKLIFIWGMVKVYKLIYVATGRPRVNISHSEWSLT